MPTEDFACHSDGGLHNPALGSQLAGLFNLEKEFIPEFAQHGRFAFFIEVEMLYYARTD